MGTLRRFGKLRLCVFPGDHGSPHFHLLGPDYFGKFLIADRYCLEEAGRRNALVRETLEWAAEHAADLALAWVRASGKEAGHDPEN